ncbi:pentapeptide repeat-containing protein [Saccharopolyspora hattusasensis]|uniref:pentapeptide repeat-containing protein n=1 Tax=Saccharopolyspora hattusasensis TaxID=1128679 RepID=UPI003D965F63
MADSPNAPDLLPLEGGDDATAAGQPSTRRWLLGISLTVGLNLAITVAAFAGLSVQYDSLSLEQDKLSLEQNKAVTEQVTSASEMISSDDFNAQAVGFRALERVARISPPDRDRVVDLAEAYLTNGRPIAKDILGYTTEGPVSVANVGTQAAVDVIRGRGSEEDPEGPGERAFKLPGMVVEAVRFHGVVMRKTQGQMCTARMSVWNKADLRGSDFWGCGFKWARFIDAKLNDVTLTEADLEDAVFTNADLTGAHLDRVRINEKTVFRGADLSHATFAGTDLTNTNFADVKTIADADFSQAIGVEKARNLRNAQGAASAIWPWSK